MPIRVFSFALYGTGKKYCHGMLENIKLVQKYFPDFQVWIYAANDVPDKYMIMYKKFTNVHIVSCNHSGARLMCSRFLPIDNPQVEVSFSRDADSRLNAR